MHFKIVSWNINSIRSRINNLKEYLISHKPDIVLLQELKCEKNNFPYSEIEDLGYQVCVHGQKTYNGVAILSKHRIEEFTTKFENEPDPEQARYIEGVINIQGKIIRVASVYVPNGMEVGSDKYYYKLRFFEALKFHFEQLLSWKEMTVIGGDFNVAPNDIDVYDPRLLKDSICFSKEERKYLYKILNLGLIDTYRLEKPKSKEFTWWDYRGGSRQNNNGLRIDLILASPYIIDTLTDVQIHHEERDKEKPSDHVPICAYFNL